jgi:DNA primase
MSRISETRLRQLRNDLAIERVIVDLEIMVKRVEGYFRFLCPICSEFHTATNLQTNLARCFRCQRNFNGIDFVMLVRKVSFLEAVKQLERLLGEG